MHPSEQSIIDALVDEGYSEEELMAVACAMVQCLLGRGLVEPAGLAEGLVGDFSLTPAGANLAAQYQQVLDQMPPEQQQAIAEKLAGTGQFQYDWQAAWKDAEKDVQFGTRMDGLAQSVFGTLGALGTTAFCTLTAGLGCAAGGGAAAAESADNITAGLTTFYTGRPTLTLQNQAWQAAGLSPEQANMAEALTGLGLAGAGVVASRPQKSSVDMPMGDSVEGPLDVPPTSLIARDGLRTGLADQAGLPTSLDKVWGSSMDDLAEAYKMDGAMLVRKPPKPGSSGNAQAFTVDGHPTISEVQYHSGGGRHESEYYKFTYKDGTEVRVIDPEAGFKPGTITEYQQYYDKQGNRLKYEGGQWKGWD